MNSISKPTITRMTVQALSLPILCLVALAPALGQDSEEEGQDGDGPLEEIVVTGIRASLENALDRKRNAEQIMDAISAEDIGKAVAMMARGDIHYSTGQVVMVDGGMTVQRL